MKKETSNTVKAGVKIGALTGAMAYIIGGLVPAFYLSSFGTLLAVSAVTGGPVEPGLAARAIVVIGTVAGMLAAGALTVAAGAGAGSVLGYLADAMSPKHAPEAETGKAKG